MKWFFSYGWSVKRQIGGLGWFSTTDVFLKEGITTFLPVKFNAYEKSLKYDTYKGRSVDFIFEAEEGFDLLIFLKYDFKIFPVPSGIEDTVFNLQVPNLENHEDFIYKLSSDHRFFTYSYYSG